MLRPIPRRKSSSLDSRKDGLANEIANAFNDGKYLSMYRFFCEKYDNEAIRRAFEEAKAVPEEQIKKSRPALFIFLLRKYALPKDEPSRD